MSSADPNNAHRPAEAAAPDMVVAGHLCLDMFPAFPTGLSGGVSDILRPGSLIEMEDIRFSTGGAVSNTGIAMRMFGLRVAFMARLGDDPIGLTTLERLSRHGNTDGVRLSPGEPSSYTVVLALPGIDRIFLHCPGTNSSFSSDDIDFDMTGRAGGFHFGYPAVMRSLYSDGGERLAELFRRVKDTGATTSLDLAMPDPNSDSGQADWQAILERTLPWVDVFVPSIEEAFYSLRPADFLLQKTSHPGEALIPHIPPRLYSELSDEFVELGCAVVMLKAGPRGLYLRTGTPERLHRMGRVKPSDAGRWIGRELWSPSFDVKDIASATGAGDTAIAAFLTAMLRGHGPEDCLRLSNAAAALNLTEFDALSGLGSWRDVERRSAGAALIPLGSLERDGEWTWRADRAVWERGI